MKKTTKKNQVCKIIGGLFGPRRDFSILYPRDYAGSVLIYAVVLIFIFSAVMVGLLGYAAAQMRVVRSSVNREEAFQIAEAGINYYQWRLAHFPQDFWDGNASTTPGPYIHDYYDQDTTDAIGRFSLTITPPAVGSTVVTIKSRGYTFNNPNQSRTVTVRYGVPSLAKYGFLTNESVWIGDQEHVSGQLHANGGIRFDGTGNAPITSAKLTYSCPSWSDCSGTKDGIWGSAPQSTKNYWQFPVSSVDFSSMTSDLNTMKGKAQSDGAPAYLSPSNNYGYSLLFYNDGTFDVRIVKRLRSVPSYGWDINGVAQSQSIDYDSNYLQVVYSRASIPPNGIIFAEDNVWVEGAVKGRVMVVAAVPSRTSNFPDIYIANNLTYSSADGSCMLGLIAQGDLVVSYYAPSDLIVSAAMIAQKGSVQVYDYPNYSNVKNSITVNGSLASYGQWTWTYVSGSTVISGFRNTYTNYDSNLLYSPPPSFPLSTSGYQQISWVSD